MGLGKTVEILALHFNNPRPVKYKASDDARQKPRNQSDKQLLGKRNSTSDLLSLAPVKFAKSDSPDFPQEMEVEDSAKSSFTSLQNANVSVETDEDVELVVKNVLQSLLEKCSLESPDLVTKKSQKIKKTKRRSSVAEDSVIFKSDYLQYKNNNLSMTNCTICGELASENVPCCKCPNIMHHYCSGYNYEDLNEYHCPSCSSKEVVDSHCTLIVCPDTLQQQWYDEISMHVKEDSIKFMIYRGVKFHTFIPPKVLAEYDIIITSFNTLRQDFNYVKADDASRRLRHRKRYAVLPCPLLAIHFWRMAIDEAQMVEADNTKLAEMCLRISSVHRWCVTGTPFNRGMEDIYGLLLFLGVEPYKSKLWWHRALLDHHRNGNFVPLFNTISQLMWRTCKADVIDQIQIPKQTEYITWLQLSAVDRHFYQQQLETKTIKQPEADIDKYFPDSESIKVSDLTKNEVSRFLTPLFQLRQACIHPSVVRNSYVNFEKKCVSMDQVLQKLIENTKLDCEEAHRKLICSLNGLAGIYILKCDFEQAVSIYQQTVASWREKSHLQTDSLQKLHTLHNLLDINSKATNSPVSDNLDEIQAECETIKANYMQAAQEEVLKSSKHLEEMKSEVFEVVDELGPDSSWWMQVLDIGMGLDAGFFNKIIHLLQCNDGRSASSTLARCQSIEGLKMVAIDKLQQIETVRNGIHTALLKLYEPPSREAVLEVSECCLRPIEDADAPKCAYCKTNDKISSYESHLYLQQVADFLSEAANTGYRGETHLDAFLKFLHSHAKHYGLDELTNESKLHLKYMDMLKKEFKAIRSMYLSCHARVQAVDELEMCISRIRFPYPGEENTEDKLYIVHPCEIDIARMSLLSDRIIATDEFKAKEGQILYLRNLEKAQQNKNGNNPDPCPICVNTLGSEWAVFRCGHCVCCECLLRMEHQRRVLRCPMCRMEFNTKSVSLVTLSNNIYRSTKDEEKSFDSHIEVKGNFSSKIEAIIRRVLWIKQEHPHAKTLLFSTWSNVLSVIGQVLSLNEITYKSLDGKQGKHFDQALQVFKKSADCNLLLLPLHSGAKGLNIIEASHVILTEPALKMSDELQAVGRVHRIGQTKETFVHRFLVRDTVEEKIHYLFKTKPSQDQESSKENGLTLNDLKFLFHSGNKQQEELVEVDNS